MRPTNAVRTTLEISLLGLALLVVYSFVGRADDAVDLVINDARDAITRARITLSREEMFSTKLVVKRKGPDGQPIGPERIVTVSGNTAREFYANIDALLELSIDCTPIPE